MVRWFLWSISLHLIILYNDLIAIFQFFLPHKKKQIWSWQFNFECFLFQLLHTPHSCTYCKLQSATILFIPSFMIVSTGKVAILHCWTLGCNSIRNPWNGMRRPNHPPTLWSPSRTVIIVGNMLVTPSYLSSCNRYSFMGEESACRLKRDAIINLLL